MKIQGIEVDPLLVAKEGITGLKMFPMLIPESIDLEFKMFINIATSALAKYLFIYHGVNVELAEAKYHVLNMFEPMEEK